MTDKDGATSAALGVVLASLRVRCSFHCFGRFRSPWSVAITGEGVPAIHYVAEGRCAVEFEGEAERLWLERGDVLFMRCGVPRIVHDDSNATPIALDEAVAIGSSPGAVVFEVGGQGERAQVLGAGVALAGPSRRVVLDALPERFVLCTGNTRTMPAMVRQLECLTEEAEQPGPGSRQVIGRITEVLFLLIVRAYAEQEQLEGWFEAARSPQIGAVLGVIHNELERDWTVHSLARFAGMSRSSFSAKFQHLIGVTPLRYLTGVRMDHAVELLTSSQLNVATIAERVGYGSEPAFATAFKRWHGSPPGVFRRARLQP
ncbi:MAG: AraC family transcriptional regulator [Nannocystales bacterium]